LGVTFTIEHFANANEPLKRCLIFFQAIFEAILVASVADY